MCIEIHIITDRGAITCYDQGGLAAVVGQENIVIMPGYECGFEPEMCLCPINIEATAKNAGYESKYDAGDYEWRKSDNA